MNIKEVQYMQMGSLIGSEKRHWWKQQLCMSRYVRGDVGALHLIFRPFDELCDVVRFGCQCCERKLHQQNESN